MNRAITVPSACGAAVAAMSLVFYAALVQVTSTPLMAEFVVISSLAAIIQIAFLPQAWVYVLAAVTIDDRCERLTSSVVLEWCGFFGGLLVAALLAVASEWGATLILAYISLSMAGSTSVQGFLRGESRWLLYAGTVIFPSALRLVFVVAAPIIGIPTPHSLGQVVLIYLLIPEITRYLMLNAIVLFGNWRSPTTNSLRATLTPILRNWFYDVGSATVEVGDKYFIGLLVSPTMLVVYFFVRKIGGVVTIVLEPFYAHRYRELSHLQFHQINGVRSQTVDLSRVLVKGYILAVSVACAVFLALLALRSKSIAGVSLLPSVIANNIHLFGACLLIDACIAANRWGRYITLFSGRAMHFLLVRIACLCIFVGIVYVLSPTSENRALILGFLSYSIAELFYVARKSWRQIPLGTGNADTV